MINGASVFVETRAWLLSGVVFGLTLASGCGPAKRTAAPVKADLARETLQVVLESWRQGKTPDYWRRVSPQVVVQDLDWAAGAKLEQFEILGAGEARDANLYCQVRLVVQPNGSLPQKRTVTYVVGTDPVLTVFRDILREQYANSKAASQF